MKENIIDKFLKKTLQCFKAHFFNHNQLKDKLLMILVRVCQI